MNPLIAASLITETGYKTFNIPESLMPAGPGIAEASAKIEAAGQMVGTFPERLMELAGRSCYDSLGQGRPSGEYHQHIQEVGHLSVCEHANMTFNIELPTASSMNDMLALLGSLINRKGMTVRPHMMPGMPGGYGAVINLNMRTLLEWDSWTNSNRMALVGVPGAGQFTEHLGECLRFLGHSEAPQVITSAVTPEAGPFSLSRTHYDDPDFLWISMFLSGSRGFSHEMVRHGDDTAISQRSTRFVDESGAEWVLHPLIDQFMAEAEAETNDFEMLEAINTQLGAKKAYDCIVGHLQPWLIARGLDKFTARKQSRGAARGFLGNALYTEMVFSASVAQWRRIFKQRVHPAADAEIRELGAKALTQIKELSKYRENFDDMLLIPSPDGIGEVLDLESVTA